MSVLSSSLSPKAGIQQHLMTAIFFVIIVTVLVVLVCCTDSKHNKYSPVVRKTSGLKMEKLMDGGDSLVEAEKPDEALVYYMVAANRGDEDLTDSERQLCGKAHLNVGKIHYLNHSYAKALEFYTKGLKIYEKCENQPETGRFYNNIGVIYDVFRDYEMGMNYYKKGYELSRLSGDTLNMYNALTNMTGISTLQGDTKSARKYLKLSEEVRDKNNETAFFMSRFNFMLILIFEKKYNEAAKIGQECIAYCNSHNIGKQYLCHTYQKIYKTYMNADKPDSVMKYLQQCLSVAREGDFFDLQTEAYRDYATILEMRGDYVGAYNNLSRYIEGTDSIYNRRDFDVAKNSQFLYEQEKINREIENLHNEQNKSENVITLQSFIIAIAVVACLIIAFALITIYRHKKRIDRSYTDLYEVNSNSMAYIELLRQRLRESHEKIALLEKSSVQADDESGEERRYVNSNLNEETQKDLVEAISKVMEETEEYCNPDFTLDYLTQIVGSNRKYVSQAINHTFNKNFTNFVNEFRIQKACMRLADEENYGHLTIRAIGESVGFKSTSTFTGVFRRITGLTPSIYQEKARRQKKIEDSEEFNG